MKRIISGVGSDIITKELTKVGYIVSNDIPYQEGILSTLKSEMADVLVASLSIEGELNNFEFIRALRNIDPKIKIILILEELKEELRDYLLQNSIYNIFEDGKFSIQEIIEAIEMKCKNYEEMNKEVISLKKELQNKKVEKIIETKIIPRIQKQETITIAGTEGAGKTLFAKQIAVEIAKKTDFKVLMIDFNTLSGNLHYLFGIDSMPLKPEYILPKEKASSISYMSEAIDKRLFDDKIFEKYIVKIKGINNLDLITGNSSAYICKNVLDVEHYMRILEKAKKIYDFIIIDTSSNIFLDSTRFSLDNATKIFFLTEATIPHIFRSKRTFDEIYNKWEIKREKISIVINKYDRGSLDKTFVREIFREFNEIKFIKHNYKYNEIMNCGSSKVLHDEDYLNIIKEFNFLPKESIKEKVKKYIGNFIIDYFNSSKEVEHVN